MPPPIADALETLSSLGGLAGLAALISAMVTLRKRDSRDDGLARDVTAVRAQVEHNHGSSMKDQLTRIESTQAIILREQADHSQSMAALRRELADARHDHDQRLHDHEVQMREQDQRLHAVEAERA
ncbi:MAG: hypothetical protein Q605_AUC00893G0003 [Actinomyces urogenitalis DORA_12]|uniref:Uncharacterized protein n=1 Tax=Actinomyces urogenitalis DORA_12 TaxID=1403939 RepID=W1VE18_9ACTO|nr:MAG: hypothetical protein Q605_AUC00893G0003 [Actinomyces urogenitalis DORA_12]